MKLNLETSGSGRPNVYIINVQGFKTQQYHMEETI